MIVDSANKADRGARVYLDGQFVKDCTFADDDAGYVLAAARDETGRLKRDGDHILIEKRTGAVRIERRQATVRNCGH